MIEPLLATDVQHNLIACSAVLLGIATAWFAWTLTGVIAGDRRHLEAWNFESEREERVRRNSRVYRWFQPLVDEAKGSRLLAWMGKFTQTGKKLQAGAESAPWRSDEFLATKFTESVIVAGGVAILLGAGGGIGISLCAGVGYFVFALRSFSARAARRRFLFERRLPFAVDLMALTMEAGAGFRESLEAVVRENAGHPVGQEFGQVMRELEHGQTLLQSLVHLRDRMGEDALNELVFAVNKAEELGTPLSQTFLRLAGQMRMRRSQAAEKAAGQANANITFPGLVTMVASLLLIMVPFVLYAISSASDSF